MSRSRIVFFLILGLAVIFVAGVLLIQNIQTTNLSVAATNAIQATLTSVGSASNNAGPVAPFYANNQTPTDPLPKYVCAADAFGSYFALEQMQVAGYDVQNGFHLGIIPFLINGTGDAYDISEDGRNDLLDTGKIDCLFTTLDSAALKGSGVITAVIDESAGADQMWGHGTIKTLNDLRGKKILFTDGSVSQFFAIYALAVAGLDPRTDVTMLPASSVDDAVTRFNAGQAEVVAGWLPNIQAASKSNGQYIIGSDKLHVIVDVIITSRQAIQSRPKVVQAFHDAWFRTLKAQFEDFPTAAKQIAAWGHNDWSGVSTGSAEKDLGGQLNTLAQAGLTQNVTVMHDTSTLIDRLDTAKRVWSAAGQTATSGSSSSMVDPQFVLQSGTRADLATSAQPHNTTFLLASHPDLKALAPNEGETLAVLPCRKFDFLPESSDLTQESQRLLDTCVLPVLSSSTGIYLKVVGSAAWPGPEGTYKESDISSVAQQRAQSVVDYLVKHGVDPKRFNVSFVLPPPERRNITDGLEQSKDRFVELTLITIGR